MGTIGQADHGKTKLTAAITKGVGEENLAKLMESPDRQSARERERGITIAIAHGDYRRTTAYAHVDCPGPRNKSRHDHGSGQMDGAILVVSAPDGPIRRRARTYCWLGGCRRCRYLPRWTW